MADVVRMFGDKLKLSHIYAVPQEQRMPGLILNLLVQLVEVTPSVNSTMDREVAPESM